MAAGMAEQLILVAGARAAPLDQRGPSPALTNTASRRSSKRRNNAVTGTPSALDSACSVVSDAEVTPFSIFDSMPSERPVGGGEIGDGDAELVAERAHLAADRDLENLLRPVPHGMRVLTQCANGRQGRLQWIVVVFASRPFDHGTSLAVVTGIVLPMKAKQHCQLSMG